MGFETIAIVGAGLSLVGGLAQGVMGYQQAKAQQKALEYNAEIERQNAIKAAEAGQKRAKDQDELSLFELGELEASIGASGSLFGLGSNMLRRRTAQNLAQRDARRVREEGDAISYDHIVQATNYKNQASAAGGRATGALISGAFSGVSSLIGGASSIYQHRQMQSLLKGR